MASKTKRCQRRAAALMEFVICLPLFLAITFGTIETCRMMYLRQSLKIAAYECARLGIVPQVDPSYLVDQCDVILMGRSVKDYTFSFTPADPASMNLGDLLTVTVSAPADSNALLGAWFYQGKILSESVSIMAEY